ncbi:MAG: hypothetical protein H7122_12635 [Chitinophagaceae bacterium]|nr:hypothetical protein [Chitinophagaceae bacterium]
MNILALFSVFGASSCEAQETNSIQHGNFTIQRSVHTEKGGGSVQNKKYDTRSYLIEYSILHKGRKIRFPTGLQKGTSYNYPWRVYILQEAPVPTLLAGSQNMFLITEEKGNVKVTRLNHHPSTFGSVQWLDNNNGQPGDEMQILDPQNDDRIDSSIALTGGNHLLINRFTVLEIATLARYPFNKKNIYEYKGWRISLETATGYEIAVGFSNKFNQVVFRALKADDKVEGRYYYALITFDYTNDMIDTILFDRTQLHVESIDAVNSGWVGNYFIWENRKLKLTPGIHPPPWKGKLNFTDKSFINYELYPVKESMLTVFLDFLKRSSSSGEFSLTDETDKQSSQILYKINIQNKSFHLTYDTRELKLVFDRHFNEVHSDVYRNIIVSMGNSFNEELSLGRHQDHFGKYKND